MKCDELRENEWIRGVRPCCRDAKRFQRFPLIRRKVVVDFRMHAAPEDVGFSRLSYKGIVNGTRLQCVEISIQNNIS
jgi:hypothetical protein